MPNKRLVVIGGNGAGMSAASQARRGDPDLEIKVFERGPRVSYAAWGVPYLVGKVVDDVQSLVRRTPKVFLEKQNIDARTGHEVSEIDLQKRRVRIQPINGGAETWEPFDQLVVATGATPIRPPIPGIESDGIFGASVDEGLRLRQLLDKKQVKKAVIVGGGYIGVEMAEALVSHEVEISLVDMLPQVMGTLDPDMADLVSEALGRAGVSLFLGEKVEGFAIAETSGKVDEPGGGRGRLQAVRTDKRTLDADAAILGLGVQPNTRLAEGAGLELGERKAIKVDDRLQTGVEGVWAVGDCVESFNLVSRRPVWVALGSVANKQGRVAGINIGGRQATFPGVVGTAVTKFMDTEIARTGLQENELKGLDLEYASALIKAKTRSHYYTGSGPIAVKLFGEKATGRLLGGQIVGAQGSAKRIDTIATALHAGLAVEDIINLDLGYAPPFSGAWDPVHIAARQLLKKI